MDMKAFTERIAQWVKKYKYAVLVGLLGVVLLCLPKGSEGTAQNAQNPTTPSETRSDAQQLELLLSKLAGAGEVKVLLSVAQGERTEYQTNTDSDGSGSLRQDTVIITDENRSEKPVVSQVLPPVYLGAVILCQGADQPAVKLAVVEVVSKLTGLGADKICVLKMK